MKYIEYRSDNTRVFCKSIMVPNKSILNCTMLQEMVVESIQQHQIKLVSFFTEDNVLSDEIKICCIFEYQSNENRAFRFFGTPGIG